ncbi:preprotein translocase subunit YajC [Actinoallomurus acaciae]|uniref:Preprotein translocase subunit YajC n=1 Tax=Actinoallomurus acaciae TaxID=502577 RepID=A0ABV5YCN0_9ACTN
MQGNTELTALTQLAAQKSNPLVTLLPIILIGVVFYFLLFRPQRRRQQQQLQMQRQIQPGQRVMTTAGMLADVVAIEDDHVVLEIAPGVEVRYVKQAISQVVSEDDDEEIEDETEDDAEETGESAEAEEGTEEPEEEEAPEVEAKTETLPGATGKKTGDAPLNDGEDKSGKRPSA